MPPNIVRKRNWRRYLFLVLAGLLICFIITAISIRLYSKRYFETQSDAAIVLGAGTANGKISMVFEERILHAITLLKKDKVKVLIFTGGYGKGQTISDSKAAKNYAISKGVPENKILIEEKSTITFYNIKNAKVLMKQNDLKTALIVSDPYHMKRSMDMCERIGLNALPSPTPTTMYKSRNTKFSFLVNETFNYWGYLLVGRHRAIN